MNEKIKNLRKILKYSDPEPTELLVGLISGLMIPLFLWRNDYEITALYFVFILLGFCQIGAVICNNFLARQRACLFTMAAYIVMFLNTTMISVYLKFPIGYELHWLFLAAMSFWNLKRVAADKMRHKRRSGCQTRK